MPTISHETKTTTKVQTAKGYVSFEPQPDGNVKLNCNMFETLLNADDLREIARLAYRFAEDMETAAIDRASAILKAADAHATGEARIVGEQR